MWTSRVLSPSHVSGSLCPGLSLGLGLSLHDSGFLLSFLTAADDGVV